MTEITSPSATTTTYDVPPGPCPDCGNTSVEIRERWEVFLDVQVGLPGISHECPITIRAGRVGVVDARGAVEWSDVRIERVVTSDDEIEAQATTGVGADVASHEVLAWVSELRCTGCGASREPLGETGAAAEPERS